MQKIKIRNRKINMKIIIINGLVNMNDMKTIIKPIINNDRAEMTLVLNHSLVIDLFIAFTFCD